MRGGGGGEGGGGGGHENGINWVMLVVGGSGSVLINGSAELVAAPGKSLQLGQCSLKRDGGNSVFTSRS